ncbi:hypothetical protein AB7C87_01850 [Natrarchaeobius sp. A-rgal3]|uniref:hypothetical protein n=1 Tax=Natrarchaeobius versutus TaxID=1679078 RepID=UPI00350ED8E9
MGLQIQTSIPILKYLGFFVVQFTALVLILFAFATSINRAFGVDWEVIFLAYIIIILIVFVGIWRKGFFISPWSLRIRTSYMKYNRFGAISLLNLFKSQRRRQMEFFKGVFYVIVVLVAGILMAFLHSSILEDFPFDISANVLETTWQVHAVIIGFSFVALTFVWEEIYNNSLSDELSRLFVEDIGSIWTVTFVFGANLLIGIITFTHSSDQTAGVLPIYTTAILFTASIATVARRFLDALDLLFYTELNEEVKNFAKEDLEKEIITTSSTPNQVLAESVSGFNQVSVPLGNFNLERTTISSRDLGKKGSITDINLRRMRRISEIVDQEDRASIDQNPTVGRTLAEDSAVLSLKGEISDESREQIEKQLRRGLRTQGGN